MTAPAAILGADGGNSKVDLLLASADGQVLGFRHGGTISHQQVGLEAGIERLVELAEDLARDAGVRGARPFAEVGAFCLAGADFPKEIRMLARAIEGTGLATQTVIRNDAYAPLRAGTTRGWGAVLICGQGNNGLAVGPDGRTARFDAVGDYSGDWGSGPSLGKAGLAAAIRATDGRGPRTALTASVPAYFGRRRPATVVRDIYYGRLDAERLAELAPLVFETASGGDPVARAIVDRLADELITMAAALIRRTGLTRRAPEVVLSGGVFRNRDKAFYQRLDDGIQRVPPGARLVSPASPPVVGAALLALDALALPPARAAAAEARLRSEAATLGEA